MKKSKFIAACICASVILLNCAAGDSCAQETGVDQLPEDPQLWLNSPPITNKILEGKGAVLYFFEEG